MPCSLILHGKKEPQRIRDEAKDALSQYSQVVAGRQAQVTDSLAIVVTVFLPLSFLIGDFGMNLSPPTNHVQTKLWQSVLLGLLLPIASADLCCSSFTGSSCASGFATSS